MKRIISFCSLPSRQLRNVGYLSSHRLGLLTSRGLAYLASVNYNQFDRDDINKCTDILDILEYQSEE